MNGLRTLSFVMAAVAAATLVFGSFGLSAATVDRSVTTAVVADDNAYVGYDIEDRLNVSVGDEIRLVEVTNRFGSEAIEVTDVTVDATDISFNETSRPDVAVGTSEWVTGTVDECSSEETVQVTVQIEGSSVSAKVSGDTESREFEIECTV
jgi:hypothetical protein